MGLEIVIKRAVDNGDISQSPTTAGRTLLFTNSGKRLDQTGTPRKYVKQVTGRHNDTKLHLAAKRGDLVEVRQILGGADECTSGQDPMLDAEAETATEIRAVVVNEVNDLGESALYIAAERGYLDMVRELLCYTSLESLRKKSNSGCTPLHIASKNGHQGE